MKKEPLTLHQQAWTAMCKRAGFSQRIINKTNWDELEKLRLNFEAKGCAESSIEEHPAFHTPLHDVGVIAASLDEEGNLIPEDRSGYCPEFEGKPLSAFWDKKKKRFKKSAPRSFQGIKSFLRIRTIFRLEVEVIR